MADVTTFANALKHVYPKEDEQEEMYEASPLLGMVTKDPIFEGDSYNVSVRIGGQQGIACDLPSAILNKSSSRHERFVVTRGKVYGVGSIDRELMLAAVDNKGSAAGNALRVEQETLARGMGSLLSRLLFGDGSGCFGQIAAISGSTITLARAEDARWFERDMTIVLASATFTASRAGTPLVITKVDRKNAILTFSAGVVASIAGAVVGDQMFVRGNNAGDGFPVIKGLQAWLVFGAVLTATLFYNVDRTSDPTRLAGISYVGNGAPKLESLIDSLPFAFQEGAKPDTGLLSPYDYSDIVKSLGTNVRYTARTSSGNDAKVKVSYPGIKLLTPCGEVEFFADPGCPKGIFFLLEMSTWKLVTLVKKEFPEIVDDDGNTIRLDPNTDSYTWRKAGYANLVCNAPGRNLIGSF